MYPMLPDFRVRQRDYLLEIAKALTQVLDLDKLLVRILRLSAEMLAGQAGLIAFNTERGGWRIAASYGIPGPLLRHLDPLLAAVPNHEDPKTFELPEVNRILQKVTKKVSLGLLTGVGLPMVARNQVLGVIFIFRNYAGRFSHNDLKLLESFADQAAIAVQNAQLYTQVNRDNQRLDALLDSVADGILILTPDHTIERCNPAFARMWDLPISDIVGKKHSEIVKLKNLEQGQTLEEAEVSGWPLTPHASLYSEGDVQRPDGSTLPVGLTYAPLLSIEGNLINVIASARDISHFREAEELKSNFISVISHELKTPVALIKGYVGTLRREDARWEREIIEDSLEVIEEESDRLAELIENLLDASRLEAGVLAIHATDMSIPVLAERLAERFETQTTRHTIKTEFPKDFPIVLADEERITQVLSNLISNSIKYAPGGQIALHGEARKDKVIVCVTDEGPGIGPGEIPHIFERFYRSETAQRNQKGAGLGLYLSRAIIEAHGGSMWVEPQPGGACICFALPWPEETPPA